MAAYSTKIINGVSFRIKHWNEYFLNEDTNEKIKIKRSMPIKREGKRCNQFGNFSTVIYKS